MLRQVVAFSPFVLPAYFCLTTATIDSSSRSLVPGTACILVIIIIITSSLVSGRGCATAGKQAFTLLDDGGGLISGWVSEDRFRWLMALLRTDSNDDRCCTTSKVLLHGFGLTTHHPPSQSFLVLTTPQERHVIKKCRTEVPRQ